MTGCLNVIIARRCLNSFWRHGMVSSKWVSIKDNEHTNDVVLLYTAIRNSHFYYVLCFISFDLKYYIHFDVHNALICCASKKGQSENTNLLFIGGSPYW